MTDWEHEDWARLAAVIKEARKTHGLRDIKLWASKIQRSTRIAYGLDRGEPAGEGTLENVEDALDWPRRWTVRILDGLEAGPPPGKATVTEENPGPEGEVDRGSVSSRQQDGGYVAHRHPDDPPSGGLSDEEVLALIRENRRLANELERRIRGGGTGPVDGAT